MRVVSLLQKTMKELESEVHHLHKEKDELVSALNVTKSNPALSKYVFCASVIICHISVHHVPQSAHALIQQTDSRLVVLPNQVLGFEIQQLI